MAQEESKRKRSAQWEMMAHCGADCSSCILHTDRHVSSRDRERHFARVATNGVVQLFNAVSEHQRALSHVTGDSPTNSSRRANASSSKKSLKKRRDLSATNADGDDDDAAQRKVPESERDRALGALRKSHFVRLLEQYAATPEDLADASARAPTGDSARQPRAKRARRKMKSEPKSEPKSEAQESWIDLI